MTPDLQPLLAMMRQLGQQAASNIQPSEQPVSSRQKFTPNRYRQEQIERAMQKVSPGN